MSSQHRQARGRQNLPPLTPSQAAVFPLLSLPNELILVIASHCDLNTISNLNRVAKWLRKLVEPTFYCCALQSSATAPSTILHRACAGSTPHTLNRFLAFGDAIDIRRHANARNSQGETALSILCTHFWDTGIRAQYNPRFNINKPHRGRRHASQLSSASQVQQLVSFGADVNSLEPPFDEVESSSPLLEAARKGSGDVIKILLEAGAIIQQRAFHLALQNKDSSAAVAFVNHVASCKALGTESAGTLDINAIVAEYKPRRLSGNTPICLAVLNKNPDLVDALLKAGAEIESFNNICHNSGNTLLQSAAHDREDCDIIRMMLLEHGADINERNAFHGGNILHVAIQGKIDGRRDALVRRLVQEGADLKMEDWTGMPPWEMAIERRLVLVREVLRREIARKDREKSSA